ncbi:transcriptional regulator CysB-like protein [Burkholderiales bacterium GJ-E10]|nr:transcriptional regulator CysB-like protein [Burkholderiales bacterium GJ-E10]
MNLQQFRYLREAVRQKLNLTAAARALHTSQPGVSKAIIELEEELGVSIFARHGKRILGLTPPGQQVLDAAERIAGEIDNLKKLARDYAGSPEGTLRVATTHTQARYVLPEVVQRFVRKYPQVRLKLLQGNPPQIAAMLIGGQADVGIATETLADTPGLDTIPVFRWEHVAVVPAGHPLARFAAHPGKITLKDLGRHPLVTYEAHFSGRSRIDQAFADAEIEPSVVLEAIDADVIKTYAQAGLGVGIVAGLATDRDGNGSANGLTVIPCGHLFGPNTTRLAVKQGAYLRGFVYAFIEMIAPGWDRRKIEEEFGKKRT